jgi:hypothetical protein
VSSEQLAWLSQELAAAEAAGERVVACCHLCFHPDACAPACLLWNYDQVLQASGGRQVVLVGDVAGAAECFRVGRAGAAPASVPAPPVCCPAAPLTSLLPLPPPPHFLLLLQLLQRHRGFVAATFAGHAHADGFAHDSAGIRHRVCKAVLETPPGRECYAIVDVFSDRICINGVDTFASEEWPLLAPPGSTGSSSGATRQQPATAPATAGGSGEGAAVSAAATALSIAAI